MKIVLNLIIILSKEKYNSTRNFKTKLIIFHEKFSSFGKKMDVYFTTSAVNFSCFQTTWIVNILSV